MRDIVVDANDIFLGAVMILMCDANFTCLLPTNEIWYVEQFLLGTFFSPSIFISL